MSVLCHVVIRKVKSAFEKRSDICWWEFLQEIQYCPCPKGLVHTDVNQALRCTLASPRLMPCMARVLQQNCCLSSLRLVFHAEQKLLCEKINEVMHMLDLKARAGRMRFLCPRSVLLVLLSAVWGTLRRRSKNNFKVKFSRVKEEK